VGESQIQMVVASVELHPEMIAAGVEAMREARLECLSDGEIAVEVYLAMVGMYYRTLDQLETIQ
jgi:hypothetical protein